MSEPKITITPAAGTWTARAGGAVIAESTAALSLAEGDYDPVIYFPRSDSNEFLDASDKRTTCPWKGEASYFHIAAKSGLIRDAAWSYEDPSDGVAEIRDHIAFDLERVAVERV